MAYDPAIAERIRTTIANEGAVRERKMFGGLAFLLNGNLAVSAYKDGGLMIRCAGEDWQMLCSEEGARPMLRKGEPVSGWVLIAADAVRDQQSLAKWVERGLAHAEAQPPK
jgi:TfoX/Sxy family transcriptional regulator of competence genes